MSHAYSVKQSEEICKTLNALRLGIFLSDVYLEHVKTLTHFVFMLGYKGKIVNAEFFSEKHRTTVAHFLNNGRWDSLNFEKALNHCGQRLNWSGFDDVEVRYIGWDEPDEDDFMT